MKTWELTIKKNINVISNYVKEENTNEWIPVALKGINPIYVEKKI